MTPEQLRAWRWEHKVSQQKLAAALEVSVLTIKRWESGYSAVPSYLHLALKQLQQQRGLRPKTKKASNP
jgi:DNA-binding transcriptional regulator YiaG